MASDNRYRGYGKSAGKIPPLVIVALCLLAAVIVTVVIGNLLREWVDDDTYSRLRGDATTTGTSSEPKPVRRNIQAFPFVLGSDPRLLGEHDAAAVNLNTPDGKYLYSSDVVKYLDAESPDTPVLRDSVNALSASISYIGGIFFPQAFLAGSADLRYVITAEECSVIREFLRAGGSEILLCGISFANASVDDVISYLQNVRTAAGGAPVGVAVPLSVAKSDGGWELIGNLLRACDFCALDLSEAGTTEAPAEWLDDASYFLDQYAMRLLLSETQISLIEEADGRGIPDLTIRK